VNTEIMPIGRYRAPDCRTCRLTTFDACIRCCGRSNCDGPGSEKTGWKQTRSCTRHRRMVLRRPAGVDNFCLCPLSCT
jgi:hypothetical protein